MIEHYFTQHPISKKKDYLIKDTVRGNKLIFYTSSSIFSKQHIDQGSRLLAQRCSIRDGMHILDLGCGYGIVGIAVKKAFLKCNIVAVDINERAVELTKKNAEVNCVEIDVRQGNLYDTTPERFDVILLNPPQTAGKTICFAMIDQASSHLYSGGCFYVVARPSKGGKTLCKRMEERIGSVCVVGRKDGYAVYCAIQGSNL